MHAPVVAALVVLSGACAKSASPAAGSPHPAISSTPVTAGEPVASQWIVVLRVAPDPSGVQDDADSLASVLGGSIQVAPGSCFAGLPSRFGADRYILGATGPTKEDVDALAAKAQIDPLFEGQVQVVCAD